MRTLPFKILAIDPGTRAIGVGVLSAGELLYFGVKTIRNGQAACNRDSQVRRIVARLIADNQPQYLAIEKVSLIQQRAEFVVRVAKEIKHQAEAQGLAIYEYAPALIRQSICQARKATKRETARTIAAQYPELCRYFERESKWETLYYAKMFDALAVGLYCQQELFKNAPLT